MRSTLLFALAFIASPAIADHAGPGGIGSGTGMEVFSPDTLDRGHSGISLRLQYTRPDQRSDANLHALDVAGIAAHNTDYNLNASLGVAYGITHRMTLSAELPHVRRDNLREGNSDGVAHLGSVSGIGDANLIIKYRLTGEEGLRFAIIGGIKIPTGSTRRRSRAGERLETEHQPGTGSWDPILGASAAAKFGWLQVTTSGLYEFSAKGAQHTRLGDRFQGGIVLSHHFAPAEAEEHREAGEEHHHPQDEGDHHHDKAAEPLQSSWDAFLELGGEWEGRQKIAGEVEPASGGKWFYAAPGVRFNCANGWSAGGAFAIPLWQDIRASHPKNDYRFMLSVGLIL